MALVVSLLLAIRSTFLDQLFKGLDASLKYHHWAGLFGVVLVVSHGVFEAFSLGLSFEDLKLQLEDPWILAGWISSLIFIVATFHSRNVFWAHKKWRWVHFLMLPAWILASAHALYFSDPQWVAIIVTSLGGLAIIRSQVLVRLPFWGCKYKVLSTRRLNSRSLELVVSPSGSQAKFPKEFAQYFYLRFCNKSLSKTWHPFTCISPLGSEHLRFAIKALGADTRLLETLAVDTLVDIEGPFGHLHSKRSSKELWIVGGVGVTTLLSRAQDVNVGDSELRALYSVDNLGDAIYPEELESLKQKNKNFHLEIWESDKFGYLSLAKIKQLIENFENADFFLAGPILFIRHNKRLLRSLKVSSKQIHSEEFIK